jgi:hypothetical protein
MATLYQSIREGNPPAATPQVMGSCLGGRVMNQCNNSGWTPAQHMTQIMNCLNNELANANWVWNPDIAGSGDLIGDSVLDERIQKGECHFVAEALRVLLVTAPPYGFGVPTAQVSCVKYDGASHAGFIAQHPVAGVFQTVRDVYNPATNALHNLRLWANHWVTYYNSLNYVNKYFDACYNVSYQQPSDMAHVDLGPLRSEMVGTSIAGEYRAANGAPQGLGGYYRLVAGGTAAALAGGRMQGPYAKSQFQTCNIL